MREYIKMLLSFFQLALAIRNVWPERLNLIKFLILYLLLVLAGLPVTRLSWTPYALFGLPVAICLFSLTFCRKKAAQSIGMGLLGFILTILISSLLKNCLDLLLPLSVVSRPLVSFSLDLLFTLLFYLITLACGRGLKKLLLRGKSILQLEQTWYLLDAALLLLMTSYLFDNLLPEPGSSLSRMLYTSFLHLSGYLLVMLLILLATRRIWLEKVQAEAKQKAQEDLQAYTSQLETMYNGLRSFKHDYINILLSLSGYIADSDMDGLQAYFEETIYPTRHLIDQGEYRLHQLGQIEIPEIKSLLCAKLMVAHESGIDVTIDIPETVARFPVDSVDLARLLGIFLDNAMEGAQTASQPRIGLNILCQEAGVSVIIRNSFHNDGTALHRMKQSGFSTKTGHPGIGLSSAQKIVSAWDSVLLETAIQDDCFIQHLEMADRKG